MLPSLRLAFGLLTVLPVGETVAHRRTAGRAMALAPLVGVMLGLASAGVLTLASWVGLGAATSAVLAVGAWAVLTRALHLDGLADTADGLGSGGDATRALHVMRASDVGPFGVVTVVLVLALQVTALADSVRADHGSVAAVLAATVGRLSLVWACCRGVRAARPDGLGALVAGSVSPVTATAVTAAVALAAGVAGALLGLDAVRAVLAVAVATAGAWTLQRHVRRRVGGVTGDVLGAGVETATAIALLVAATA